ncbi:MAG: DUF4314 domain-containing protein [Ruminococcus sp.]|nr:DUF4314 domain-containing protein [Ruminococcus sp.]
MNKAEYYKKTYPVGTRIRLLHMDDPFSPIKSGIYLFVFTVNRYVIYSL